MIRQTCSSSLALHLASDIWRTHDHAKSSRLRRQITAVCACSTHRGCMHIPPSCPSSQRSRLSLHSSTNCDCTPASTTSTSYRQVCSWHVLDVNAFAADHQSSELITTPAEDIETGVDCYNSTQRALLDKHAPVELKRITTRSSSARWYDRERRNIKRHTRKLERVYRRLHTAESAI